MRVSIVFTFFLVMGMVLQAAIAQGPGPVNVLNYCQGHIVNICPGWDDPAGAVFTSYEVSYAIQGQAPTLVTVTTRSTQISGLLGGNVYDFIITGIDAGGVRSLPSATTSFTTDPNDAKSDPALDINNIVCDDTKDPADHDRIEIACSWGAAAVTPLRINTKCRCSSAIREPLTIRKSLYGTNAAATTITFHVHRDVATCYIKFRAYYTRRPASRHSLTVIIGQ